MIRHVLVPGLMEPPPAGMETADIPRFPVLERLLARADRISAPLNLDATLLELFQFEETTAVAPLCWLAESGEEASDWVLQATPVHFRADRDHLLLFKLAENQIDPEEAMEFARAFNKHFVKDGLVLKVPTALNWYIVSSRPVSSCFAHLSEVAGRSVAAYMPRGDDADFWRSVINEIQMLYFQFQEQREQVSPANGLWLSGAGRLPKKTGVAPVICEGKNMLLSGLEKIAVEKDSGKAIYVMNEIEPALEAQDKRGWVQAMDALEYKLSCLAPDADRLVIYPCQGIAYHWNKRMNCRFWRKREKLGLEINMESNR
jgi:hypothetical protein